MTPLEKMQWAQYLLEKQQAENQAIADSTSKAENQAAADSGSKLAGYLLFVVLVLMIGAFLLNSTWQSLQSTVQAWHDLFISVGTALGFL